NQTVRLLVLFDATPPAKEVLPIDAFSGCWRLRRAAGSKNCNGDTDRQVSDGSWFFKSLTAISPHGHDRPRAFASTN
ncbi:MAG: hypothetical protein ACKO10_00420, partial [Betaproteobacteria bacterium]